MTESDIRTDNKEYGFGVKHLKAVLFDMDGVLFDSMPSHAIAWAKAMALHGVTMTREEAYATEGQRGVDTIRQMMKAKLGKDITMEQAQSIYNEKTAFFNELPEAAVMPGVKRLMQKIHRDGADIGVVTGSGQRPLIERLLREFGDYVAREHIITAYDVERGKPAPDPYLKGLEMMGGLKPSEAIVVENAPLGVEAGVAAGIFTICVNSGSLPKELFVMKGANRIFDTMEDLAEAW